MYEATTKDIRVQVRPQYLPDRSSPTDERFFWAYSVAITNLGGETVQLVTRHWRITDAEGRTIEVKGDGVVGEQPVLAPGESFEYTSGTPLSTSSGIMFGTYQMIDREGQQFDVEIPAFSLDGPCRPQRLN